jgi:hypothetical protein
VITVALDPEYEDDDAADDFEIVEQQHVVEKHNVIVTAVNAETGEEEVLAEKMITKEDGVEVSVEVIKEDEHSDAEDAEEHAEHAHGARKTTTKITKTILTKKIKKKVEKKPKEPVVRSVEWTPEAAETAFPATFVFDPVQSREAVVTITVAPAAASAAGSARDGDESEAEPVKEIEFPVSSLFQGKDLDQWYTIKEETTAAATVEAVEAEVAVAEEETSITELAEEEKVEAVVEEDAAVAEKEVEEAVAEAVAEVEAPVDAAVEAAVEAEVEAEKVEVEATEEVAVEATVVAVEEETASATADAAPAVTRFHVQATFVLSEIEALSLEAVNLSKKKQEAEAVLAILEREAASLRTKYERLNASQRSLGAASVSKPKSNLLLGRNFANQTVVQKSSYQKVKDSVSAVLTPQRQQVVISVAMFFGSACLFHFQGENLLA